MSKLVQNIRFAVRVLRRTPGYTAVALLSLALGIGGNTAVFSIYDAQLLKQLPVKDPQHLVKLCMRGPFFGQEIFDGHRLLVRIGRCRWIHPQQHLSHDQRRAVTSWTRGESGRGRLALERFMLDLRKQRLWEGVRA